MDLPIDTLRVGYDRLPVPVLIADRQADGGWTCAYRNPEALALLDAEAELPVLLRAISALLDRAESGETGLFWNEKLGGRQIFARFSPLSPGRCLVTLRDITWEDRVHQESLDAASAALRSALDAANAASRAKSDFLSSMSHDIRTPLNAVIGMTTIAQAHLGERERVEDCLEKIGLASRHLLALVNNILDVSRIESGKLTLNSQEFTLADLTHSLMAIFRPQADKKRQQLLLDFSGVRHERLRGDELRLRQVLANLLSNALKFTPEEGRISLRIRETPQDTPSGETYAYYEFAVEDTGIGIPEDFLSRIFLPFERAESAQRIEGSGLGMTITHSLVEMMNGQIRVESGPGKGTLFTVTLPLELLGGEETGMEALRGLRVLAADSDEGVRSYLREILGDAGVDCQTCSNAWEANELASQAHMEGRDYFAILLAWHMPMVDGVQACRELRAMLGDGPAILLMSSFEWTYSADEMRKLGISAFLPKPIFRSRLFSALGTFTPAGKAARAEASAPDGPDFSGRRILLAEDNELNREIAVELIEATGAKVDCAENGREAVELFRQSEEGRYDMVFMDLQMPVMDGLAATRAIRALPRADSRRVPIVAMTANAFVEDIRACRAAGMDAHLAKPVSVQQLTDIMRESLAVPGGKL